MLIVYWAGTIKYVQFDLDYVSMSLGRLLQQVKTQYRQI